MEITSDYLFKVIGIERVNRQILEEENIKLKENTKKLMEEKETIQKALKQKTEDV